MAGFAFPFLELVNTTRRYLTGQSAPADQQGTELPHTTTRTAFGGDPGVTFAIGEILNVWEGAIRRAWPPVPLDFACAGTQRKELLERTFCASTVSSQGRRGMCCTHMTATPTGREISPPSRRGHAAPGTSHDRRRLRNAKLRCSGARLTAASPRLCQVGVPLQPEMRLHCCRQLFNFFDEERRRELEEKHLQVRRSAGTSRQFPSAGPHGAVTCGCENGKKFHMIPPRAPAT